MRITRKNSLSNRRELRMRRPAESELGDKPAVSSESEMEDAAAAVPPSSLEAQVSFFITQAQKKQLRKKGYSDDQIARMKPAEAHWILGLE
jgi:hypothetical protein